MSRFSTVTALLLGAAIPTTSALGQSWCASDEMNRLAAERDPSVAERRAQLEHSIHDLIAHAEQERAGDTLVLTIPMVFHIIHDEGPENIPDVNILDQMAVLNRDYRKLNPDVQQVCCGFDTIAADIRLQFKLATRTPFGECTNGIDRIRSIETYVGDDGSKLDSWNASQYLNVWVVNDMNAGTAGYAYLPPTISGFLSLADGVIIRYDYIGRLSPGSENNSRALTHEIGHYFDLEHVWGGTNVPGVACGDDLVEDTPITKGWDHCPTPAQSRVCTPGVYENFENYMDYSYCSKMFTKGQSARMRAALASAVAFRNNLYDSLNLVTTGVAEGHQYSCAPKADFYPDSRFTCAGDQVTFKDNSGNGVVTSWLWNFQDGEPSTSTEQNPTVTFTGAGYKTVTLTVSNSMGVNSLTLDSAVRVAPEQNELYWLTEDFSQLDRYQRWGTENHERNNSFWSYAPNAGYGGGGCARLNAFNQWSLNDLIIDDQFTGRAPGDDIDELVSPTLDLSGAQDLELGFRVAYATGVTTIDAVTEKLEVYISNNCGHSWNKRYTLAGIDLISDGAHGDYFTPTLESQWAYHSFAIPPIHQHSDVRIKFRFTSGDGSNNLYIDDINLMGAVGIDGTVGTGVLGVYPNPASGAFRLNYNLPTTGAVRLEIADASGRILVQRALGNARKGELTFSTEELGLASGVYEVVLTSDGSRLIQRLVVR